MSEITRVGVDLAKALIQVHAVDASARPVVRRALPRKAFLPWCAQLPAGCEVVMEACSGAHHWARELGKRGLKVRLIAPHLVTPYRMQGRSGKNDANDAAAVCEAAGRPRMHFVPVKNVDQQGVLAMHRIREGFIQERTACINRMRAVLAEFGLVAPLKPSALRTALPQWLEDASNELPGRVRVALARSMDHWRALDEEIVWCERQIDEHARTDAKAQLAQQLLGVGKIGASALVASVGDFKQFRSARQFSAWLGLVPSQNSSGGKQRLGSITKRGNEYLRMLLVRGARAALLCSKPREERVWQWAEQLRQRRGWQTAAVALAAKNARILWAMLTREQPFAANHLSMRPS